MWTGNRQFLLSLLEQIQNYANYLSSESGGRIHGQREVHKSKMSKFLSIRVFRSDNHPYFIVDGWFLILPAALVPSTIWRRTDGRRGGPRPASQPPARLIIIIHFLSSLRSAVVLYLLSLPPHILLRCCCWSVREGKVNSKSPLTELLLAERYPFESWSVAELGGRREGGRD